MNRAHASRETSHVRSVQRAITLMEALAERTSAGVTELAEVLDVPKSTAFRLLATLQHEGMVEQDERTAKYQLGPGVARLARTVGEEVDLRRHARDALERLAEDTAETVNLAILEGRDVVYVEQVTGSASVLSADWLGWRTPIHSTASGKVLVSHLSEGARRRLLGDELEACSPRTITDVDLLEEELERILVVGYATTIGELEIGLNAVASPVVAADGAVVAAVSVSGPDARMPEDGLSRIGERTRVAGREISHRLGHR
jgi:DNA-binding IclR family transcriptional regulator